ncbi:MAG: efflux RND transporter periplasmic adaptor subunit [Acidobacteria bacterium]|nr:efflux RND transporter periplasmic adaptor subunit [Acidobacteriota bacterium]MBI3426916.1 efflux RND transporter periplasmic adaptor subunit [Acidobacteriota bacterium]
MKSNYCSLLWLLLAAAAAVGCRNAKAYEKPLTPVRVQAVQPYTPDAESSGARYSATIRPAQQLELAFKHGGYLQELLQVRGADGRLRAVQEGDWIRRGTVLARLRAADFTVKVNGAQAQLNEAQAARDTSQAQLAETEAALRQAQRDLERATNLFEADSLTRPEFDAAKTKTELAQAKVGAARAQTQVVAAKINSARAVIGEAQLAQGDAVLRAPLDALVLRRNFEEGSLGAPGAPRLPLAEAGAVKAVFAVPDLTVTNLKLGVELALTCEALANEELPKGELRGRITRIGATADARTRVFEVEVTIARPPAALRAGMIATLVVPETNAPASAPRLVVPLSAIVRAQTESYAVLVVAHEQGKQMVRRRAVKLGAAFGNLIEIVEGLQAGEQVVSNGATVVSEGEPVQITE